MQLLAAKQSNEDLKEGDKNIFIFFLSKGKKQKRKSAMTQSDLAGVEVV